MPGLEHNVKLHTRPVGSYFFLSSFFFLFVSLPPQPAAAIGATAAANNKVKNDRLDIAILLN